jgi:hypothetical protein
MAQALNNDGTAGRYHPGFKVGGKISDAVGLDSILMMKEASLLCDLTGRAVYHAANYIQESCGLACHARCALRSYVRR